MARRRAMKRDAKIGLFIVLAACIVAAWLVGRALARPGISGHTPGLLAAPEHSGYITEWLDESPRADLADMPPEGSTEPVVHVALAPRAEKAEKAAPSPDPAPAIEENYLYPVKAGENFWIISQKVYARGKYFDVLRRHNPEVDPLRLDKGMLINVPSIPGVRIRMSLKRGKARAGRNVIKKKVVLLATATWHIVREGDRLDLIAKKYYGFHTRFNVILKANPGINPNNLKIGAKLKIPALEEYR